MSYVFPPTDLEFTSTDHPQLHQDFGHGGGMSSSASIPNMGSPRIGHSHRGNDAFLDWDFDIEPSIHTEAHGGKTERRCPTCKTTVDLAITSLHSHVTDCFFNRQETQAPGERALETCPEAGVGNVKQYITKMDLRTRLGMMESFYRLSKSQEVGELSMSQSNATMSPNTQANDDCVLNLLYGTDNKNVSLPSMDARKHESAFRSTTSGLSDFDLLHDHGGEDHDMLLPSFSSTHTAFSFSTSGAFPTHH